MVSYLLIFDLSPRVNDILLRQSSPVSVNSRVFLSFSSINFSVFLIGVFGVFELEFMQSTKYGFICIPQYEISSLTDTICWRFFCSVYSSASLLKMRCPYVCGFMSKSFIWSHCWTWVFYISTMLLLLLQFYSTTSNQEWWEPQNFFYCLELFNVWLTIFIFFYQKKLRIVILISMMTYVGIVMVKTLNLCIAFGGKANFN